MIKWCDRDGCHHMDVDHVIDDLGHPTATFSVLDSACNVIGCDCKHFLNKVGEHPEALEIDNGKV